MFGDGVGEAVDRLVQRGGERLDRKLLEALDQRQGEAVHAVAVLADVFALHVVEHFAHLVGRVLVMVQEGDEVGDGALEVDVVLPERVVGVDEQVLAGRVAMGGGHGTYHTGLHVGFHSARTMSAHESHSG